MSGQEKFMSCLFMLGFFLLFVLIGSLGLWGIAEVAGDVIHNPPR